MRPPGIHDGRWSPPALVLVALSLLGGPQTAGAGWETALSNGQPIVVDPATNRAVIRSGVGQGRPLWDGVHRLQDGSTITIRSGVVTPNAALGRPAPPAPSQTDQSPSATAPRRMPDAGPAAGFPARSAHQGACDELVLRTCGLNRSCAATDACGLAALLRSMQRQTPDPRPGNTGWAEDRCREALRDGDSFPACAREPPLDEVACSALSRHACTRSPRCRGSDLCRNASALLELERSAVERNAVDELHLVRRRCTRVFVEHAFFPPCR